MTFKGLLTIALATFALAGCSSANKNADYANANVTDEIAKLDSEIADGLENQYDVLAPKEFERAQKNLKEAKEDMREGDGVKDVLEEVAESRAALAEAKTLADRRREKINDVLAARKAAIDAGAHRYNRASDDLKANDDSFRKNASELDKRRNNAVWDRSVINYKAVGVLAIQDATLGEERGHVREAIKNGARYFAPESLKTATKSMREADKAMAHDPGNQASYQTKVAAAKRDVASLMLVTAESRKASRQSNEDVAREIIAKDRASNQLKDELSDSEMEGVLKGQALVDKEMQLRGVTASANSLTKEKRFNEKVEAAREAFSKDEAEVYRQGENLVIRLKKVAFKSGQADLPSASLPLLGKVRSVIKNLNAKEITVEGHTDSVGSPAINKKVSEQRAEAVAKYLGDDTGAEVEAVGFGFENPITSNRTPAGRATNRRVDIVITPTATY